MYAFGHKTDGDFAFAGSRQHTHTFPNEKAAREFFVGVEDRYGIYEVDNDLGLARLVERGTSIVCPPAEIELTDAQKTALWSSYVYKSTLNWSPVR